MLEWFLSDMSEGLPLLRGPRGVLMGTLFHFDEGEISKGTRMTRIRLITRIACMSEAVIARRNDEAIFLSSLRS
jgi:hypothetical protein